MEAFAPEPLALEEFTDELACELEELPEPDAPEEPEEPDAPEEPDEPDESDEPDEPVVFASEFSPALVVLVCKVLPVVDGAIVVSLEVTAAFDVADPPVLSAISLTELKAVPV